MCNILSIWFGANILIPSPAWLFLYAADSSLPKSGISLGDSFGL